MNKQQILHAYEKASRNDSWLRVRHRPRNERFEKHPFLTLRYALLDKYWKLRVASSHDPMLPMQTFWGDTIRMRFPDYRSVLHHGLADERELPLEEYLVRNLSEKDVFIDIGANVGFYSSLSKALGAQVHAFEMSPKTFEILKQNVPAATLVNKALARTEGQITYTDFGLASGINSIVAGLKNGTLVTVEATTLDSYCSTNNIQPTVIKMDVEGAEREVLEGSIETLKKCHPVLLVETDERSTVDFITSLGYRAYRFGLKNEILPYDESTESSPNLLFKVQ